jgi:hypothetical protein
MEMLRKFRDDAQQRGQLSAAIRAEELRAYVSGEKLPPKGETKH